MIFVFPHVSLYTWFLSSTSHSQLCPPYLVKIHDVNDMQIFWVFLYFRHARDSLCFADAKDSAKTLVNPDFFAFLRMTLVFTTFLSLWRITRFHTWMHRPAFASLSEKGTSPARIFLHFFSEWIIPSVITLSIISIANVVSLVAGWIGGNNEYVFFCIRCLAQ